MITKKKNILKIAIDSCAAGAGTVAKAISDVIIYFIWYGKIVDILHI